MALHLKRDFAKLCSLTTGNLTNYIKRKQVIMSGDYVDDSVPQNREFLARRQAKKPSLPNQKKPPKPKYSEPVITTSIPNVWDPDDDDEDGDHGGGGRTLNEQKMIAEIEFKRVSTEVKEIQKQKLQAILIPTELATNVIVIHTKSIVTEFKNEVENILTRLSKKKDFTRSELAELRGEITACINAATDKSVSRSKRAITQAANELAEKKGVGERGANT